MYFHTFLHECQGTTLSIQKTHRFDNVHVPTYPHNIDAELKWVILQNLVQVYFI